nr:MAG TPA: hypothetical protein [Caudoviricetes sp.]
MLHGFPLPSLPFLPIAYPIRHPRQSCQGID